MQISRNPGQRRQAHVDTKRRQRGQRAKHKREADRVPPYDHLWSLPRNFRYGMYCLSVQTATHLWFFPYRNTVHSEKRHEDHQPG